MTKLDPIQFDSATPIYQQLVEIIKSYINRVGLKEHDQLPSRRFWMGELKIGENTVKKAIDKLVMDQLLYRRKGKGIFVAASKIIDSKRILILPLFKFQPNSPDNSYSITFSGIFNYFSDHNVELISRRQNEDSLRNILERSRIDGVIIAHPNIDEEDIAEIVTADLPVVSVLKLTCERYRNEVSYVDCDNIQGTCQAVDYMIQQGHRDIGLITGQFPSIAHEERLAGYKAALENNGLPFDEDLVIQSWYKEEHGYDAMNQLLTRSKKPTAVMAMGDLLAIGAVRAIKEAGLKVPQDISICGFTDMEVTRYTSPPLTSVRMPLYDMGAMAAEIITRKIEQRDHTFEKFEFEPKLIVRESVGKLS